MLQTSLRCNNITLKEVFCKGEKLMNGNEKKLNEDILQAVKEGEKKKLQYFNEKALLNVNEISEYISKDDWSDGEFADRLAKLYGNDLKYNHDIKSWLRWNGNVWEVDKSRKVQQIIEGDSEVLSKIITAYDKMILETEGDKDLKASNSKMKHTRSDVSKLYNRLRSARGINGIDELLQNRECFVTRQDSYDRDDWLINTKDCIYKLDDDENPIREHDRKYLCTKIMDLEINSESAQEPPTTWLKFLNDISNGRLEWIEYLQKVLGYCLTGDTSEQKIFFFCGDGSNGKSTLCNVIRDIFGGYAKSVRPSIIANNNKNDSPDQANSELASLPNVRLALAEEGSQGVSLDEATVKQITGGTEISTRKLYADTFQFTPKFKLIMCTNHKPRINGNDYGIWRRVILIPFDRIFKENEKDKTLGEKLKKEYPQILNWIINGFYSWQADGLDEKPQCIQDAITEYKDDENPLSDFTAICLKLDENEEVKSGDLWKVYDLFCADEQIRNSISQTTFGKIIRALPNVKKKRKRDGIYYSGLKFTDRAIELLNPFDNDGYNNIDEINIVKK